MSDTPPPELVDTVAEAMFGLPFDPDIDHDDQVESWRATARDALAALAEWADGALIDPSTWTVVEAERETGWCVYWGHGPDCECDAGARWVLSPREGER